MIQEAKRSAAFVLHAQPTLESSLEVWCLSQQAGIIRLQAKGARRPRSPLGLCRHCFVPVLISWWERGRPLLTQMEALGPPLHFTGNTLVAALYVNELLMNLLPQGQEEPQVFHMYSTTLNTLTTHTASALRRLEYRLLQALGYGLHALEDAAGAPLKPDQDYVFYPQKGWIAFQAEKHPKAAHVSGRAIMALEGEKPLTHEEALSLKPVVSQLLAEQLNGKILMSRTLWSVT